MEFKNHSNIKEGDHAYLGASTYHWLNYDDEKLAMSYRRHLDIQKGTELHAFAAQCIKLGQKLRGNNTTLSMYVNDAIGFRMTPEQVLYYSENCFGTADAISFRKNFIRVHDLKTGYIKANMKQLYIYVALFCLEYGINPGDVEIETRIYQNNEICVENPHVTVIVPIMDKIVHADEIISRIKSEEGI